MRYSLAEAPLKEQMNQTLIFFGIQLFLGIQRTYSSEIFVGWSTSQNKEQMNQTSIFFVY